MPVAFLSTPSGWRATKQGSLSLICSGFLSTPSGWRATTLVNHTRISPNNFYPRPPGGGRQATSRRCLKIKDFYPRPPGGGRRFVHRSSIPNVCISIHALRVEGDSKSYSNPWAMFKFLSTPSGWRATRLPSSHRCTGRYFYPRPPGGGRL